MTEVTNKKTRDFDRIYPQLADPNSFRLTVCSRTMEMINENLSNDVKKRDSEKKKHSRLRMVNGISSAGSAALSVSGAAVSASGIGAVAGVPLIGVGAILGFSSLVTIAIDKEVVEKLTRCEKLISLGQAKLGSIRDSVSKALSDEVISEEEFKKINAERTDYDSRRSEILSSRKKSIGIQRSRSLRVLTEELLAALGHIPQR